VWNRFVEESGRISFSEKHPVRQREKEHHQSPSVEKPSSKPVAPGPGFRKINPVSDNYKSSTPQEGDDIELIRSGMLVTHATFGQGTVMSVEGSGPNKKASVRFDGAGVKQLLLRFAKLKIIG